MTSAKGHQADLRLALLAALCALAACIPNAGSQAPAAPTGFCVRPAATCTPDPGWNTVDCAAAEAGLEFLSAFNIADFEQSTTATTTDVNQMTINKDRVGQFLYSYTDATAQIYANRDGAQAPVGYEPISATANVCNSDTTNRVLHLTGGPFLGWGGGIGVAMEHFNHELFDPNTGNKGLCPYNEPPQYDFCPPPDGDETGAISTTTFDMSKWDGVAVWARRAPDSQPLLRVLVGNKYVDEDINYKQWVNHDPLEKHYCERVRECACANGKDCDQWSSDDAGPATYYCGNPAADPPPGTISSNGVQATNSCNITRCDEPYPAYAQDGTDPPFYGRPCTPYAFRSGFQSSYCFDPTKDPLPAESDQQCGDYWTFPLHLTTEWQLFLVPFTTMYQQGWAKRWPSFDISSVSVVRLTWDAGWVDCWIDNLRFYRVRR